MAPSAADQARIARRRASRSAAASTSPTGMIARNANWLISPELDGHLRAMTIDPGLLYAAEVADLIG